MRKILLLTLVLFSATAFASKDKGIYLGGGFNLVSVGIKDPFSNTVDFKSGEILLGYKYNPWLGLEVRGGQSLQDETLELGRQDTSLTRTAKAKIESYSSVYYRAELANEIAKLYLLLGQSNIETSLKFPLLPTENRNIKDSGISYGIGFGLWLDERMNLNFEIKTLVKTDSDSFTSGGISADYRF